MLPLAQWLLWFSPALSLRPGHTPIQELNWAAVGKALACGPASATICCAASTRIPGMALSRVTAA